MEEQVFRRWDALEALPACIEILGSRHEADGLEIRLADASSGLEVATIVFRDFVAYRNINERFRFRTWHAQARPISSGLLVVEKSRWLRWLAEESGGVLDPSKVVHYAIYTMDDCIDVASRLPPKVALAANRGERVDVDAMTHEFPTMDESREHPLAHVLRPALEAVVEALGNGDYTLRAAIPMVERIDAAVSRQIEAYVQDYGETLVRLPHEAWSTSVSQWTAGHWDVLVDLWTAEAGRSDLVLAARVTPRDTGYVIRIMSVHVP